MKKTNMKFVMRPALAACLCMVLLLGCAGAAYAADVGGIRQTIQVWINGQLADVEVVSSQDLGGGAYEFVFETEDSRGDRADVILGGGGVAIGDDGTERPLTPEEVAESFACEVVKKEDGTVWLYYYDRAVEITDRLVDGRCTLTLEGENGKPLSILRIEENGAGGYSISACSVNGSIEVER